MEGTAEKQKQFENWFVSDWLQLVDLLFTTFETLVELIPLNPQREQLKKVEDLLQKIYRILELARFNAKERSTKENAENFLIDSWKRWDTCKKRVTILVDDYLRQNPLERKA